MIAGSAWLVVDAGVFFLLDWSRGSLSLAILLWAFAAVPTAFQMIRWLDPGGRLRVVVARLRLALCVALAIAAVIVFVPLVDWHRRAPHVVSWFPPAISLCGAVVGFVGRGTRRSPAERIGSSQGVLSGLIEFRGCRKGALPDRPRGDVPLPDA